MKVELLYFDDCPSWQRARENLDEALEAQGVDADVEMIRVETDEAAQAARFPGSPTIRVDGMDLFPPGHNDYSLACRVYHTPDGQQGWPTQVMIESAMLSRFDEPPWATASLRIFADDLDPDTVTALLGIEPKHQHRNGEQRIGQRGTYIYRQGMWSLGTEWDTRELAEHLRELLEQLDGAGDVLKQLADTATVDFFCGFSEGQGFELPPDVLKQLGEIGIPLGICMYSDPKPLDNFDDDLMNIKQNG